MGKITHDFIGKKLTCSLITVAILPILSLRDEVVLTSDELNALKIEAHFF